MTTWRDHLVAAARAFGSEPMAPPNVESELLEFLEKGPAAASGALCGAIIGSGFLAMQIETSGLPVPAFRQKHHRKVFEIGCLAYVACERAARGEASP